MMETNFKYFKGKTYEEILSALSELSIEERLKKALENNLIDVVEDCLNKDIDYSLLNNKDLNY